MRCQLCQKNKAQIHSLEKVNGEWLQQSICEQCATGQQGQGSHPGQLPPGGSKIFQFFGQILIGSIPTSPSSKIPETVGELLDHWSPEGGGGEERSCPGCGMSFERFQELRRLGCARCYELFRVELEQIFGSVHSSVQHVGKTPGRPTQAMPSVQEITILKEKLDTAIKEERFEEAALYRDKLRELIDGRGEKQ